MSSIYIRLLEGAYIFSLRIGDFHGAMASAMRAKDSVWHHFLPSSLTTSDWMIGVLDHFMGRQGMARQRCTNALRNFPTRRRPEVVRFGIDQRILAHCANARALWLEGFPDQALAGVETAIAEVDAIDHPVSLCIALLWTTPVLLWTGEATRAAARIERAARLAAQFSLGPYQSLARGLAGQLAVLEGDPAKGVELIASSLLANEQARHMTMHAALQLDMAEALAGLGRSPRRWPKARRSPRGLKRAARRPSSRKYGVCAARSWPVRPTRKRRWRHSSGPGRSPPSRARARSNCGRRMRSPAISADTDKPTRAPGCCARSMTASTRASTPATWCVPSGR